LALEGGKPSEKTLATLTKLAREDKSPVVRLYLASGAGRLPLAQRWGIVEGLANHGEDSGDHNLPLMVWYALEPLAGGDPAKALEVAAKSKLPNLLPFIVRRIGSSGTPEAIALLVEALGKADDVNVQLAFLRGLQDALKGRRQVDMPKAWPEALGKLSRSTSA